MAFPAPGRIKKPYHTLAPPRNSAGNANSAPSRAFSGMNLPSGAWNSTQFRLALLRACPTQQFSVGTLWLFLSYATEPDELEGAPSFAS